jgi:hypothetical protein
VCAGAPDTPAIAREMTQAGRARRRATWGSQENSRMHTEDVAPILGTLFAELVKGPPERGGAFMLNSGDVGFLRSLDRLSAAEASQSTNGGATIAAHAQHVRYGLSLMNQWASEGGDPFANPKWDLAWKTSSVDEPQWQEIKTGLGAESERWLKALTSPRDVAPGDLAGMIGSIAHLAYHVGAIRQISKATRGPTEGTF